MCDFQARPQKDLLLLLSLSCIILSDCHVKKLGLAIWKMTDRSTLGIVRVSFPFGVERKDNSL